jgi:long-chain fatty acid transport protein
MQRSSSIGIATVLGAVIFATDARATGYELREQSAVGQGAAFAGAAARGDDPSMIFFNPAAMAWLPGTQAVLVGSGVFPTVEATSGTATRNAALGGSRIAGSLGGDIGVDAFVPAAYVTTAIGADWRFGLSVTAPWGLVTKSANDSISRYHALTSSLRTIDIAPAVSWRPLPNLAFGAALNIQYAAARLSNAVDFGAVGARAGLVPGSRDGRATVTGNDTDLGWQIGAQWEPLVGTRLGLAFRSAVFHGVKGDASFEGVPAPLTGLRDFAHTSARAKLVTPETLTLGLQQRIDDRITLLVGAEWTNWSRFQELVVTFDNGRAPSITEQRWRDSWFLSLGGEYRWNEALTLRAGIAYDQTPVRTAERTPRIPDNDRTWLSIGASYALKPGVIVSAGYTHIFAPDARVNLADPGPGGSNLLRGNLNSVYSASVDIVTAQLRFMF